MSTNPFARGGSLMAQLSSHSLPTAAPGAQHTPASPSQPQPVASTSTPPRATPGTGTGGKGKGASPRSGLTSELVTPPRVGSSSPFGSPSSSPSGQPPTHLTPTQSPSHSREDAQSSPGSSVSGSPQSSNGGGGGGNVSRRVKLYKLTEEHWQDLGTGICLTHYNDGSTTQQLQLNNAGPSTPPSSANTGEEGGWILVRREPEPEQVAPQEGEPDPPPRPPSPSKGEPGEIILRSKVFPYPQGYDSSEEDEDETGYDKQGRPLDPGGYQRQQDTLIVWTDKATDDEMALSFATPSGCAEVWGFIKNARKLAGKLNRDECIAPPGHLPTSS